jgi:hypothetical protein
LALFFKEMDVGVIPSKNLADLVRGAIGKARKPTFCCRAAPCRAERRPAPCAVIRVDFRAMGTLPATGMIAPEFELPDSGGTPRRLSTLVSHEPVVLLFYRGHW